MPYQHTLRPSVAYLETCGMHLLDSKCMAEFLGVTRKVLHQQLVYSDRIPLSVRLGLGTTLRWNVLELLKWIEAGCPRRTDWIRINGRSGWFRQ